MDKKPTGLRPFARRQQGRSALVNKLIRPRGSMASSSTTPKVNITQQHELVPFVRENMQRVMDGENVLEVLPELEYVADIVISGILSTKDLITCSLNYDSDTQAIDPDLKAELLREVRRFFTTKYPISDKLYEVLYDTLFRTGSYALAINLIAGAVVAVVIVGVILGQLEYNTWTAAAGSTIWCKFFLDFALSRQAHGLAKGKQATPKT